MLGWAIMFLIIALVGCFWIFWDCLSSSRDCPSLILRIPDYVRRILDFRKTKRLLAKG